MHQGAVIGPGTWDPIITSEQGEALQRFLTAPERRTNRSARTYLLSGMCRCFHCNARLLSVGRHGVRRYLCRSGLDGHGGCGKIAINAEPVDQIVAEAVLLRLDSPDLHDALQGRVRNDKEASALHDSIERDTAQLDELAAAWADREIDSNQWKAARGRIERRREVSRRDLNQLAGTRELDAYLGQGETLRSQWSTLNLDRQRAVVKVLVDQVIIKPGVRGARSVAVERVSPVWRF